MKAAFRNFFIHVLAFVLIVYSNQADKSNIMGEPTITWTTNVSRNENGQLILNCTVNMASMDRVEMKWELPNQNIAMKVRRFIHTPTHFGFLQ